jgi:tetratricopeptide (TPR) repeat protein
MKKRSIAVLILFLLVGWSAMCQSKKHWQNYGNLSFAEKDYIGASVYYQRANSYDHNDLELLWKYSHSLLLSRNYMEAEERFSDLLHKDSLKIYIDTKLWLGILLKNNGKYLEAKEVLADFLLEENLSVLHRQKTINELAGCDLALKDTYSEDEFSNSGNEINTPFAEFAAFVFGNQSLIFSSQRQNTFQSEEFEGLENYPVKLFKATQGNNSWSQVTELSDVVNNSGYHVCNGTMSEDGRYLYYSACDREFRCEIMASKYSNGIWGKPVKLNSKINMPGYSSTQPNISIVGDQELMLFVSDRPGGQGNLDIWYSIKRGDLDFLEPINLGSLINSPEDDVCPWYNKIDSSLYFSSSWLPGFGAYDIFKSTGLLKKMSKPINLGKPYNSPSNDLYFSINAETNTAYLTSNRVGSKKDTLGNFNDVWQMTLPFVQELVKEIVKIDTLPTTVQLAQNLLPLQLYFHNDQPKAGKNDTIAKYDYQQTYIQYLGLKNEYKTKNQTKGQGNSHQVELFFDEKIQGGFEKLNQLCEILLVSMTKGENIVLGIKGFASNVGNVEYNNLLSKRRLSALEQYFESYKGGVLLPYLSNTSGGTLKIIRLPFEKNTISNLPNSADKVYGLEAANDRKIEIYNLSLLEGE